MVQGGDVVLQCLLDLPGIAVGEPAERHSAEMGRHASSQVELKIDVGQMGQTAGGHHKNQPDDQGSGTYPGDDPGAGRIHRPLGQ